MQTFAFANSPAVVHCSKDTKRTSSRKVKARAQKPSSSSKSEDIVIAAPSLAAGAPATAEKPEKVPSPAINIISPISRWSTGVPPAMGGHYMPSGELAPLSMSKAPGVDIAPLYFTYPAGESEVDVAIYDSDFAAASGLADLVARSAAAAIAAKGSFTLALSGGSLVRSLEALVGRTDVDFSRWWVFFVDERVVPLSHADSNYAAAQEALLRKVAIPASHVITIKEGLSAALTAEHYAGRMLDLPADVLPRTADGNLPALDLVLLGVGPDGHVASLFPNRKETAATSGWVLPVTESPKPPAQRITLTMPVLNAAMQVAVVALGAGKAEVVQRALEVQSLPGALPVQLVRPDGGRLSWVLDKASAGALEVASWEDKKKFPRSTV